MRVTGAGRVNAPVDAVWSMLRDPVALAGVIPGCESLEVTGPGRCAVSVTTAIAAVAGVYSGEAKIREQRERSLLVVTASAAGARGSIAADITVRLTPANGGTEVGYEINADLDGAIAGVGQLVHAAIAQRLAREFVAGLNAAVEASAARETGSDQRRGGTGGTDTARPDNVPAEPVGTGRAETAPPQNVSAEPVGTGRPTARPDEMPAEPGRVARAGVLAGAAIGVAGIAIGAVLARRMSRARNSGTPR